MNYDYKNLPPFKWFVMENFPFIEETFDAMDNWQLFCKLGKEINKVIKNLNDEGTQVENLTNAYNDLVEYVNNYFENLDVTDEVNAKLDEMALDGTLEEIIGRYLTTSNIKVRFLYRGDNKGDCSLIQTQNKNILVDLGSTDSATLISKLHSLNISKIDYVIISHFHGDHVMGYTDGYDGANIQNLLDSTLVDFSECIFVLPKNPNWNNFIYSDTPDGTNRDSAGAGYVPALASNIATIISNNGNQIIRPDNTTILEIDDKTKISFMNANQTDYDNYYDVVEYNSSLEKYVTDYNNFSLVVLLTHENHNFLFTGDIEKPAETQLAPNLTYVDVLKVEHHAGNEEVDAEFYNKCSPKIAVIMSTGATGRNSDMINGLQLFGTEIYSSNVSQDVVVTSTTNFLFVESTKGKHVFNGNILKANKMNNFANVYSLSNDGIFIENGTDLNDLTIAGIYYCNNSADAQTLINTPYIDTGFKLIVEYTQATNRLVQTIITNNQAISKSYVRTKVDSFGAWNRILKEQEIYSDDSGSTTDITLSKSKDIFNELTIFYHVGNEYFSKTFQVKSGSQAITLDYMKTGTENLVLGSKNISISGTSLTVGTSSGKKIKLSDNTITNESLTFTIDKIVGY